jgi:protein arginine N-methyltransferase 2
MLSLGWDKKPGVTILFGRWQDVLDQLESYDAIYFDTYGEFYKDMQDWHEHVTNILRQDGRYSFFNGLAATNPVFHKVSCRVAELELSALGLNVEWEEMHMDPKEESVWEGVRARYWKLDTYWFPLCRFADY